MNRTRVQEGAGAGNQEWWWVVGLAGDTRSSSISTRESTVRRFGGPLGIRSLAFDLGVAPKGWLRDRWAVRAAVGSPSMFCEHK